MPNPAESDLKSKQLDLGKYLSLDAWRGIAALAVVLFHCVDLMPQKMATSGGLVSQFFHYGYLGVYVFFPISGYCILNALVMSERAGFWGFFRRRLWRIYPAYWGSLLIIYLLIFIAMPFNGTSIADLGMRWWEWLSLFTLTQGFFNPGLVNVVYWTLGLELQFYLVMGCLLFFKPSWRPGLLLLTAFFGSLYRMPWWHGHIQGLFLGYWLEFLVGAAVIGWRIPAYGPRWSIIIWEIAAITAAITMSFGLIASLMVSWLLLLFYRWDEIIFRWSWIKGLSFFGLFSYSLYLIHYPLMRQAQSVFLRIDHGTGLLSYSLDMALMVTIATSAGLLLYYAVEKTCIRMMSRWKKETRPKTS